MGTLCCDVLIWHQVGGYTGTEEIGLLVCDEFKELSDALLSSRLAMLMTN